MDGLGSITWWGFSPAIDFRSYLSLKDADKTDVNGLSGDSAIIYDPSSTFAWV